MNKLEHFIKMVVKLWHLELNETKKMVRKRYVYINNNVIFEIDKYTEPVMNVVAIEGNKDEVDNIYNELKVIIDSNIIND